MTLVVGLGNPGAQYALTRHNIGFILIDEMVSRLGAGHLSSKFQGELFRHNDTLFLKPSTFMNLSGASVGAVAQFYKPARIIVVQDDMDLPFGALRFKFGGSSGGHNGIRSIDQAIGTEYERMRFGIGHSRFADGAGHVLGKFSGTELDALRKNLDFYIDALNFLLAHDVAQTQSKFSKKKGILDDETIS